MLIFVRFDLDCVLVIYGVSYLLVEFSKFFLERFGNVVFTFERWIYFARLSYDVVVLFKLKVFVRFIL